ncbi:unnamed protein product [Symbiodinium sp. CCMP2592]|nr:unnamed protein product [Symbiodinium sp. CCMP2592]
MSSEGESNGFTYTSSGGDSLDDTEYELEGKTLTFQEKRRRCLPVCCSGERVAHCCYVCQFLLFLLVFPLWAKWLLVNPMPRRYWHSNYAPFPMVQYDFDSQEVLNEQMDPKIQMSEIPEDPGRCNYSCSEWRGYRTEEMNFRVSVMLNDSALMKDHAHTVYPVLLASADFQDWWVVGDKRFAHPTPFWSKHTERRGVTYVKATSACTNPPPAGAMPKGLSGAYVMACITWRSANLDELSAATTVTDAQIAQLCEAVGGVCGWSCGSKHSPLMLRGCDDNGKIEVTKTMFAGKNFHNANFQGKVSIRQCPEVDEDGHCVTSEAVFSHWRCHNCKYNPNEIEEDSFRRLQIIPGLPDFPGGGLPGMPGIGGIGGGGIPIDGDVPAGLPGGSGLPSDGEDAKSSYIYTSLPKLEVSVTGLGPPDDDNILSQPGVVIFESSETTPNSWQPLYREAYIKTRPPIAVDPSGQPITGPVDEDEEEDYEEKGPQQGAFSRHRMHLSQGNRLTMEPKWCFGKQGPLYLVACAVNGSIYGEQGFKGFTAGQKAAPPPFNDRCLEVSGRCAHACMSHQEPMANCSADGRILQSSLVSHVKWETADTMPVFVLCILLLVCFAIKVLALCPGIFWPYRHYRRYDPELTEHLRFINVCVPSEGENKAVTLRSLIGAIGCIPKECSCRFHITLVDDEHRLEMMQMFLLLTKVVEAIPGYDSVVLNENVREFFLVWVESTKKIDISQLRENALTGLEKETAEWLSGLSTYQTLRENSWATLDARTVAPLEAAVTALNEALLSSDTDVFTMQRDTAALLQWRCQAFQFCGDVVDDARYAASAAASYDDENHLYDFATYRLPFPGNAKFAVVLQAGVPSKYMALQDDKGVFKSIWSLLA